MINKKYWDILILSGDLNDIDIFSSYISNESLGSHFIDKKQLYYFEPEKKVVIEDILANHINNFNIHFSWEVKQQEDWHLNWKNNFTPININNELIIIPDWDNNFYDYNTTIKIKPGMAFGTGHHETTFLMLKHLLNNIKPDFSVLDLGSGSGILSIAAHIYGAKKVTAVEFDIDCQDNFYENLMINNIDKNDIEFIIEDVLEFNNFNYDMILANINKNIIKKLIPNFKNTKSTILLSGLLEEDGDEIKSILKLEGINLIQEDQRNEWILMVIENV